MSVPALTPSPVKPVERHCVSFAGHTEWLEIIYEQNTSEFSWRMKCCAKVCKPFPGLWERFQRNLI